MASMQSHSPTPQEAQAALAEAADRAEQVRRSDDPFRYMLLGMAGLYVAIGVLVGLVPHGGSAVAGIGATVILAAGVVGGLGIAAAFYVALGALGLVPQAGPPVVATGVADVLAPVIVGAVIVAAVLVGLLALHRRTRVYSRSGSRWFNLSLAVFSLWNGAVVVASFATGWWAAHQPSSHFTVSAVVAAIPLLAAFLIGGRGR
jgi:hypothetical protein